GKPPELSKSQAQTGKVIGRGERIMSKKQRTWKLAVSGVLALTVIAAGVFTYRYESASYKEQMDELEEQQTAEAEEKEKQEEENAAQENAAEEEPETADASTDSVDAV